MEIIDQLAASIKKGEGEEEAYEWLAKNGFGGLIKTKVMVAFGKGEYDEAGELADELVKMNLDPAVARSVHASTFKSFAREQTEKGETLPQKLFNVYTFPQAKINLK